ncbi:MAG: DUF5666 domain-containing protein [Patescibacteria group bacterium]|nr:DUF5666 domain-containing protein [Patescibacteria group bacterium]
MKQLNLKKLAGLAGVLVLIGAAIVGTSILGSAKTSQAQTANSGSSNTNSNGSSPSNQPPYGWGKMEGRGQFGSAITGTVSSVNGNTITLAGKNGTTYTVDASKAQIEKFANNAKTTIQVSGIASGDTLTVFGPVSNNNVAANRIIDGNLPARPARQTPAASGTVTAINGNTITLAGSDNATYTVDASNAQLMVVKPAGTSLQNSGIANGDTLTVFGTLSGNNIAATRIFDGNRQQGGFGIMHR